MLRGGVNFDYSMSRSNRMLRFSAWLYLKDGSKPIQITQEMIDSSGLPKLVRGSQGNQYRIGTADSATFRMTLDNTDQRWDGIDFEGAKIIPWTGVDIYRKGVLQFKPDPPLGFHLGHFFVSSSVTKGSTIDIVANDLMTELDLHTLGEFLTIDSFPLSVGDIIKRMLTPLGLSYDSKSVDFTKLTHRIPKPAEPEKSKLLETSVRDVIRLAALLYGGAAYFNRKGELCFVAYPEESTQTVYKYDDSNTMSAEVGEQAIFYSGVQRTVKEKDKEAKVILYGNDKGLVLDYPSGDLYKGDETYEAGLAQKIASAITSRAKVYPFKSQVKNILGVEPYVDYIDLKYLKPVDLKSEPKKLVSNVFFDKDQNRRRYAEVKTLITYYRWEFQKPCEIACAGTSVREGKQKSKSEREFQAIKREVEAVIQNIPDVDKMQDDFGMLVARSKGLYFTYEKDEHGAVIRYEHDRPSLKDSVVIWKYSADTSAVSNDGGKTWKGMDSAGNQFANLVAAQKIAAKQVYLGASSNSEKLDGAITSIRAGEITLSTRTRGKLANMELGVDSLTFSNSSSYMRIAARTNTDFLQAGSSSSNLYTRIDSRGKLFASGAEINGTLKTIVRSGGESGGITLNGGHLDIY